MNYPMKKRVQSCSAFIIISLLLAMSGYSQDTLTHKIKNDSLWRDTSRLEEVVISTSIQKPEIQMSGNKMTLNVANSPIYSTNNAYDIIKEIPGVMELNNIIRFRMKSVTVLVDGKTYRVSDEDLKNILSSIPGNIIDKVEVNTAPSAKFDAQGGTVINIITKRKKDTGVAGSLIAEGGLGKYGQGGLGGSVNYKFRHINLYANYNYAYNKTYTRTNTVRFLTATDSLFQQDTSIVKNKNNSYRIGADYEINSKKSAGLEVSGFYNNQNRNTANYTSVFDTKSVTNSFGQSSISNPTISGYFKMQTDSMGSELSVNASYMIYNKHWNDYFNTAYFTNQTQENAPSFLKDFSPANNNIKIVAVDYDRRTAIGNFSVGTKMTLTKTDNNIVWDSLMNNNWYSDLSKTNHFIYRENIYAGYITYSKAIKSNWQIDAGIRGELTHTTGELFNASNGITTRNYFNLFPNLSINYIKNLNNIISFSYNKSINRFGFDIVNPFIKYQSQYSYSQGNPTIQPQIDHALNLIYTYKQSLMLGVSETHSLNAIGPVYYSKGTDTTISSSTNYKNSDFFYFFANFSKRLYNWWTPTFVAGTGYYRYNTSTSGLNNNIPNNTWSYLIQFYNSFSIRNVFKIEWNNSLQGPMASGIYMLHAIFYSNIGLSREIFKNKSAVKLSLTDIFNSNNRNYDIHYNAVNMNIKRKQESRFIKLQFTYPFGNNKYKHKTKNKNELEDIQKRLQ
jgi:hypothetical protein